MIDLGFPSRAAAAWNWTRPVTNWRARSRKEARAQLIQAHKLELLGASAVALRMISTTSSVSSGLCQHGACLGRFDDRPIDSIENATRRGAMVTRRLLGRGVITSASRKCSMSVPRSVTQWR